MFVDALALSRHKLYTFPAVHVRTFAEKGHGYNVLHPDIMQKIISIFINLPEDNLVFGETPFLCCFITTPHYLH